MGTPDEKPGDVAQVQSTTPVLVVGGLAPGDDGTPWPVLTLVQGGVQVAIRMDMVAAAQVGQLVVNAMEASMREARTRATGLVLPGQQGFPGGTPRAPQGMPT